MVNIKVILQANFGAGFPTFETAREFAGGIDSAIEWAQETATRAPFEPFCWDLFIDGQFVKRFTTTRVIKG